MPYLSLTKLEAKDDDGQSECGSANEHSEVETNKDTEQDDESDDELKRKNQFVSIETLKKKRKYSQYDL